MSTREAKFWDRIVGGLWDPKRMLQRVENGLVDGMPDSYIVSDAVANWVELKCPIVPARPSTALFSGNHNLSQSQRNWLLMHRQAGGRGWVGIETEEWVILIGAQHADSINSWPLSTILARAAFTARRPMDQTSWRLFLTALTNRKYNP